MLYCYWTDSMVLQKRSRRRWLRNSQSIFAPSTRRRALRWCSSVTWPESHHRRWHGSATVTSLTRRRPTTLWRRSAARVVWRSNAPLRIMPGNTRARRPILQAHPPPARLSTLSVSQITVTRVLFTTAANFLACGLCAGEQNDNIYNFIHRRR